MTNPEVSKAWTWLQWAQHAASPTHLIVRLTDALKDRIPEGYEDESGFHFGATPTQKPGFGQPPVK